MQLRQHLPLLAALWSPAACAPGDQKSDPPTAAEDSAAADAEDDAADGAAPSPDCAAAPLDCDGEDNDCDDLTDEGAESEERQLWGRDADGDGYPAHPPRLGCAPNPEESVVDPTRAAVDCDDADSAAHPDHVEDCGRPADEDCDGSADCDDPDCDPSACLEDCRDAADNDRDGLTDCEDSDCVDLCVELCHDTDDNDRDGLVDCADPDCGLHINCWTDLHIVPLGGATMRVMMSTSARPAYRARRDGGAHSVTLDAVEFSGQGVDASGAPVRCAARVDQLHTMLSFAEGVYSTFTSFDYWTTRRSATAITATLGSCPTPTSDELAWHAVAPSSLSTFSWWSDVGDVEHLGVIWETGLDLIGWAPRGVVLGERFHTYRSFGPSGGVRYSHAGMSSQSARAESFSVYSGSVW